MVSIEEAACCPKCSKLGIATGNVKTEDEQGAPCDVTSYVCDNEVCPWYTTGWIVQSDGRGNVYERNRGERGMDKTFPQLTPGQLSTGRAIVEQAQEDEQRATAELKGETNR